MPTRCDDVAAAAAARSRRIPAPVCWLGVGAPSHGATSFFGRVRAPSDGSCPWCIAGAGLTGALRCGMWLGRKKSDLRTKSTCAHTPSLPRCVCGCARACGTMLGRRCRCGSATAALAEQRLGAEALSCCLSPLFPPADFNSRDLRGAAGAAS